MMWHNPICTKAEIVRFALVSIGALALASGCAATQSAGVTTDNPMMLKHRAEALLQQAIVYPHNPVVRVEAVEALQACGSERGLPQIRAALTDEHPGVRFAACLAVGSLYDASADGAIQELLNDPDDSVRVAALFARHRLGHTQKTGKLGFYLLDHADASVRRNAALALGLLGEKGAIKILAKAMRDRDEGVRHHALEAMARLGHPDASKELAFLSNAGIGSQEVFAIQALAGTDDPRHVDTFRYKLATGIHLETKLAAARALGDRGDDRGYDLAARALLRRKPTVNDPNDPPDGQVLRVRQMAASALGAIGRTDALPSLQGLMADTTDPRLQASAAGAVLCILDKRGPPTLPFLQKGSRNGG